LIAPVTHYSVTFVSTQSSSIAVSSSPSWSVQLWNFSAIQAASPAGESVRAYASVCGLVP
jgi:hypothetical protein